MATSIKLGHKARILAALRQAGHYGQYNYELARQRVGGHRFGEYIRQLKSEGHIIKVERIKGAKYRYTLLPDGIDYEY